MRPRVLAGLVALVFAAVPALAADGGFAGSFIDLDNDGAWTSGDLPLADYLGPQSYGFDAFVPQPGYVPRNRPVGLVIQGTLSLQNELVQVIVTGDIHVRGNVTAAAPDVTASFTTVGGNIDVAPGVVVSGRGDVLFEATNGGDVHVGSGGRFSTRGDVATVGFRADGTLTVDGGVQFQLRGGGYSSVFLHGHDGVTIAPDVSFRAPGHGDFTLLSGTDLALSHLALRGGYLHIEAYSDARHPAAKHVDIADSVLQQTYRNGDFRIIAGADARTSQFAPHALVLERTQVQTRADIPLYVPNPEIR